VAPRGDPEHLPNLPSKRETAMAVRLVVDRGAGRRGLSSLGSRRGVTLLSHSPRLGEHRDLTIWPEAGRDLVEPGPSHHRGPLCEPMILYIYIAISLRTRAGRRRRASISGGQLMYRIQTVAKGLLAVVNRLPKPPVARGRQ
jgi:hypothetical protein